MSPTSATSSPPPRHPGESCQAAALKGRTQRRPGGLTELKRQDLEFREASGQNTQDRLLERRQLHKERAPNPQKVLLQSLAESRSAHVCEKMSKARKKKSREKQEEKAPEFTPLPRSQNRNIT